LFHIDSPLAAAGQKRWPGNSVPGTVSPSQSDKNTPKYFGLSDS
jgi:hypothetical protein